MKNLRKEAITGKPASECEKGRSPAAELPGGTARKNPESSRRQVMVQRHVKEIDPSLVVRSEKVLGCGTFGNCYLAYYKDVVVTVKEFKPRRVSLHQLKEEVRHEARMINQLEDLFGVVTKSVPLRLITKFHGQKEKTLTLFIAINRKN